MPLRQLRDDEARRYQELTDFVGDAALLQPTATGLKKSILDATLPVRSLLRVKGVHDYSSQQQGPANKLVVNARFIGTTGQTDTRASLYRPETKDGDPRIWFSGLPEFADADDMLALFVHEHSICVVNLTKTEIARAKTYVKEVLEEVRHANEGVVRELLAKLRKLAKSGFIPAVCSGDTAVGRTLETLLGIQQNSNKTPDYRGIELKSYRQSNGQGTRVTLFSQVPNWEISKLKGSREILEAVGYARRGHDRFYCTISTIAPNSLGVSLKIDSKRDLLVQRSSTIGELVVWEMAKLHDRLLEKHRETFWIRAQSRRIGGVEQFQFEAVRHTAKPLVPQFDTLLEDGRITLDNTIKNEGGRVKDKGYLFKMWKRDFPVLFPNPKDYALV